MIPGSGRYPGEGMGYPLQYSWASLVAQMVKNLPAVWDTWVQSLVGELRSQRLCGAAKKIFEKIPFCNSFIQMLLSESLSVVSDSLRPHGLYSPRNSPGQNTGVGSLSLFQGIFPTQESNPGLLHYTWILYELSHKGSPRILERVACPFSRGSS